MSEQLTLLELELKPEAPAIWERNDARGKIGARYTHKPSGWVVIHCSHPTANFPYYIQTDTGERILAPNGRGFRHVDEAKQAVEAAHAKKPPMRERRRQ
jgi:hypothetical protein